MLGHIIQHFLSNSNNWMHLRIRGGPVSSSPLTAIKEVATHSLIYKTVHHPNQLFAHMLPVQLYAVWKLFPSVQH